jgi:hypothetical protein
MSDDDARDFARKLITVLKDWRVAAKQQGISDASIKAMEPAFRHGLENFQEALR